MNLLEVRDLRTSFFTDAGEVKAVNGISFNLDRGKVLGIVGESGSGKSVTAYSIMQILAGTGRIVSGSIKLDGQELVGAGEKVMKTVAERTEAYRRIDKLVSDAVPYVLLWQTDEHRILYWNRFGSPEKPLGIYGDESAILTYWWHDQDRADELKMAIGEGKCLPTTTN